jgi:ribonuclease P protein component
LLSAADFARVRDTAPRSWPTRLLVLYAVPNDLDYSRVGITVSGRVGNAVVRNRVKRRIREALRASWERITPGLDLVVIARVAAAEASWEELTQALRTVLQRAGATNERRAHV